MKKQLLALALIVVVLAIGASSTLAYFTTLYTADNVISVSGVSVAIIETKLEEGNEVAYPAEPVEVMPATTASKIVRANNDGPEPIWVRVKVETVFTNEDGDELPASVPSDTGDKTSVDYASMNYNTDVSDDGYWILKEDGYYYYSKILAPGEASKPLFTEVSFDRSMGNEYMNSTLKVNVYCSAVQSANNPHNNLPYPPDAQSVPDAP